MRLPYISAIHLMNKDFWLDKWQNNDIPFHRQDINPELMTYCKALQLQPGDHVLVPLCGKSKDLIWLAYQGFHVTGVELSPIACEDFFTDLNVKPEVTHEEHFIRYRYKNIDILCGDFFDLSKNNLDKVDAIYDCKALIALPLEMRRKYVSHLLTVRSDNVKILLMAHETPDEVIGPPFSVTQSEIEQLYGTYFNIEILKQEHVTNLTTHMMSKGYREVLDKIYLLT